MNPVEQAFPHVADVQLFQLNQNRPTMNAGIGIRSDIVDNIRYSPSVDVFCQCWLSL
jgi:hypothetical protein